MKRPNTKIEDIFAVKVDTEHVKYLQYIISDLTQLNSDVIRVFKQRYHIIEPPDLATIVGGEVEFYTHCVTILGCKMGHWDKVGNHPSIGQTDNILFRDSGDNGNPQVKISEDWWVWKINESQKRVGKLTGENVNAEIGIVMDPISIVNKMKFGYFGGYYPSYK